MLVEQGEHGGLLIVLISVIPIIVLSCMCLGFLKYNRIAYDLIVQPGLEICFWSHIRDIKNTLLHYIQTEQRQIKPLQKALFDRSSSSDLILELWLLCFIYV